MDLHHITERLRELLLPDPPSAAFDENAEAVLTRFVKQGQDVEALLCHAGTNGR